MARKGPGVGEFPESQETGGSPSSSIKSLRFPLRPGKGSCGTPCKVKANHFSVVFQNKDLHHYYVSIIPETSRGVNRAVIKKLVKKYIETHLGNRLPAYDGMKSLYTAGALPFESKEFEITLNGEKDCPGGARGDRDYIVALKFASRIDLSHLAMFLHGKQPRAPQEALQALNIVLNEIPNSRPSYCPVGRSFYSLDLGKKKSLGYGLESWRGFYQSFRPTQRGLSLNIDMSSTTFIEHIPVIEFVTKLLVPRYNFFDYDEDVLAKPLSGFAHEEIERALCGVEVEVTHAGLTNRRIYCISGLTSLPTKELNFSIESRTYSVAEYFLEKYKREIKHTNLPCLEVGNSKRSIYLPMEVCWIRAGQRYSKRLNEEQNTELLKVKCQRPYEREMDILRTVKLNAYANDPHAKEFGIKISSKLARVEARVLSPPWLKYHYSGEEEYCLPEVGQWNMMDKKMFEGGQVKKWTCISFAYRVTEIIAKEFCNKLAIMCQDFGMEFDIEPVSPVVLGNPDKVEFVLKELMIKLKPPLEKLDLLMVILPDNNGSLYGDLKRICETKLGIVSQCCLQKHVINPWKQYLANVALKINVKVGGKNTVLGHALSKHKDCVGDISTIIFGADVTHPHPGDNSSPSIAAVVASQDWPEVSQYTSSVCAQIPRQECIQDLYKTSQDPVEGTVHGGMIRGFLMSWKENNNKVFPERIIFYRDGVSEGQFSQVLFYELDAIRKACASLQPDYKPTITFVVVQKRHHTRLFASNHDYKDTVDSSGNILPGTVVDSKICHPREFDFYLCSHAGIHGTSRPAHYHVLWDENNFSADDLQSLTNNLCYTYARCTRSVSIVPPVYYAHLAASRARFYMKPNTSDHMEPMASDRTCKDVKPLPKVKPNVNKFMFYC